MIPNTERACAACLAKGVELTYCPGCGELVCEKCGLEYHMKCVTQLIGDIGREDPQHTPG